MDTVAWQLAFILKLPQYEQTFSGNNAILAQICLCKQLFSQ